ncbi:hypothetical protein HN935_02435 [archaeon]|mgnify:CR=1 FL=1|jgi:hypothetical protein|nr:hypothetical protein [archaeon]
MVNYVDENGYKRGKIKHSDLIHRQIAYEFIYKKNKGKYSKPFSSYIVHHIDGDKKNNDISNLQIMTQKKHEKVHGIIRTKKERDLFEFEEKIRKKKIHPLNAESISKIIKQNKISRSNLERVSKLKNVKKAEKKKRNKRRKMFFGLIVLFVVLFGIFIFNGEEVSQNANQVVKQVEEVEPYEILIDKYTMIIKNNQDEDINLTIVYQRYSKWFGIDEVKEVDVVLLPNEERKIVDEGFSSNSGCSTSPCQLILKDVIVN